MGVGEVWEVVDNGSHATVVDNRQNVVDSE